MSISLVRGVLVIFLTLVDTNGNHGRRVTVDAPPDIDEDWTIHGIGSTIDGTGTASCVLIREGGRSPVLGQLALGIRGLVSFDLVCLSVWNQHVRLGKVKDQLQVHI